ncbi:MAG TPA: metallophosphoesterase [Gammaproteobacteria bacterium]|nr:metallophosphoesterase [Gammaproteobacteria bacterium]
MKDWRPDPERGPVLHGPAVPDFDADELMALMLANAPQTAGHGETYAGRPATRVLETARHFLKLQAQPLNDADSAASRIATHRAIERQLGVHPPDKIWFALPVCDPMDRPLWLMGNRTTPLRILDAMEPGADRLQSMLERYFRAATEHGKALDLSLSNFGVDAEGTVWYVDDDVYDWQDDHGLHDFLGLLLRQGRISSATAQILGRWLANALVRAERPSALDELCQALRDIVLPAAQAPVLVQLLSALSRSGATMTVETPEKNRANTAGAARLALIADVHGNLPALEAVLDFIAGQAVDRILVLGDVVGYGPHPQACVDRLRERDDVLVIRGNHDNAVVTGEISGGTTSLANWSWQWSRERLDEAARTWLADLPCFHAEDDWLAVHGAPVDASFFNAYVYRMSYEDNLDNLQQRGIPLCFHGHTHLQQLYCRHRGRDAAWDAREGNLSDVSHALLSPGSVGQPRCGEPGAELAIFDLQSREYRFHRLAYDIERTLHDMRRFAFPNGLIERLQAGQ